MNSYKTYSLFGVIIIFICGLIGLNGCSKKKSAPNFIHLKEVKLDNALPPLFPVGSFNPKHDIFPVVEQDSVTGLPDTLNNMKVWHAFLDYKQYFYWAYKHGIWSKKDFENYNKNTGNLIKSEKQTKKWVDCIVTMAFGKNSQGQWVVILDRNNNEDLNDDKPVNFKTDTVQFKGISLPVKKAKVNLTFQIYRNHKVLTLREPFVLIYELKKGPESLGLEYDKYLRGQWKIKGKTYDVSLTNLGFTAQYVPEEGTYLLVDLNKDGKFGVLSGSNERYRTDQPFNIEGITWKVDSIKPNGTTVYLTKPDTTVLPKLSLRKGAEAPNFTAKTLNDKNFSLNNLRGKYVLLDFWGTWCPACLKELPNLKKANQRFSGKNFEIIGICVDSRKKHVKQFVENRNITWPQIFVSYGNTKGTIVNLYDVIGYPSEYLINPEGKVVASGMGLRGKQLIKILKSKLNQP
jgi:peroxiredoxin